MALKALRKIIIVLFFILLLFIIFPGLHRSDAISFQSEKMNIYIIYDTEKTKELGVQIANYNLTLNKTILNYYLLNIDLFDRNKINISSTAGLILIIEDEHDFSNELTSFISEVSNKSSKFIFSISTIYSEFEPGFLNILGISSAGDTYPETDDLNANWTVKTNKATLDIDREFKVQAKIEEISGINNSKILVEAINSDYPPDEKKPDFPLPVLLNTTRKESAKTFVSSALKLFQEDNDTHSDQGRFRESIDLSENILNPSKIYLQQKYDQYLEFLMFGYSILLYDTFKQQVIISTKSNQTTNGGELNNFSLPLTLNSIYWVLLTVLLLMMLAILLKILNITGEIKKRFSFIGLTIIGTIAQRYYFSRERVLDETEVLSNPVRNKILEILQEKKFLGAHIRELKETLNLGSGALLWHLQVLQDFGYVKKVFLNGYVIFVLKDYYSHFDSKIKLVELVMKNKNGKKLLAALRDNPRTKWNITGLSRVANINRKSTRNLVKKLTKLGIMKEESGENKGRHVKKYCLTNEGESILETIYQLTVIEGN